MMSSLPSRTDPGAILIFLKPNKLDRVIQEGTANLIATLSSFLPGIGCATYYRAADPVYEKQHLILCQVGNSLSFDSKALESILQERGGQVEFDVRIFRQVQIFGPYNRNNSPAPTILIALMQPPLGGEANLDAWYRREHCQHMSKQPGWLRTRRYSLLSNLPPSPCPPSIDSGSKSEGKNGELSLRFLAVHEFGEGEQLRTEIKALQPLSAWTMIVVRDAKGIEAGIWRRVD